MPLSVALGSGRIHSCTGTLAVAPARRPDQSTVPGIGRPSVSSGSPCPVGAGTMKDEECVESGAYTGAASDEVWSTSMR